MFKKLFLIFLTATLALSACGTLQVAIEQKPTASIDPDTVATIVAATPTAALMAPGIPLNTYQDSGFGFEFLYANDITYTKWEPAKDILSSVDFYTPGDGSRVQPSSVTVSVFANADRLPVVEWLEHHKNPDILATSLALYEDVSIPEELTIDNHPAIIFRHSDIMGENVPALLIAHDNQIVSISYISRGSNPMRELFLIVVSSFRFTPVTGALVIDQQLKNNLDRKLPPPKN